jgi:hypoxanthine phosphoribosyltransferase
MGLVARKLIEQIAPDELTRLIGVGGSGGRFAQMIQSDTPIISVTTTDWNRNRLKSILTVGEPELTISRPILIDDVAVTGKTLSEVKNKLAIDGNPTETALIGLLYQSKRTRKQIGLNDIRAAVIYANKNGEKTPLNSLDALMANKTGVLDTLLERYFDKSAEEMRNLIQNGEK